MNKNSNKNLLTNTGLSPVDVVGSLNAVACFNNTNAYFPEEALIHELFERQVKSKSSAVAISHEDLDFSYIELNHRANQLAHYLRSVGVGPDLRVAICMQRGFEMVVGVLAVLKAGGAYVPLDPMYPAERLSFMLEDSAPIALLTEDSFRGLFSHLNMSAQIIDLVKFVHSKSNWPTSNLNPLAVGLTSHNLSHIIYTSGSTGKPKGVAIEHRNVVNLIVWGHGEFKLANDSCMYFSTSLNFDLSVFELFVPITMGGRVRIVRDALSIAQAPIDGSLINGVPSAINALLDMNAISDSVSRINLAGEPLKKQLVEKIFSQTHANSVCNLYGPTETTTYSTWIEMKRETGFVGHIGRPLANTLIYILDENKQPLAIGETGEIYIGGAGVARGYLNRPELTAERFLNNPFTGNKDGRLYKTGDLGRWLADGNIEYLGRNDFQVKIRGFRIELGEIENQLENCPCILEALVVAIEDNPGSNRLVAYLIVDKTDYQVKALRKQLKLQLPEFMIPSAFVVLDKFPLTPNGKIDRSCLPLPALTTIRSEEYQAPQGSKETDIADIWQSLLRLTDVSRLDNFFELGGHSLLAVQLVSRLCQKFGVAISLHDIFEQPTIKELAIVVEQANTAEWTPLVAVDHSLPLPMSSAQQRLWFLNELDPVAGLSYHIASAYCLKGVINYSVLRLTLDRLIQRHESYRTRFVSIDGEPMQVIDADVSGFCLVEKDLSDLSNGDQEEMITKLSADVISQAFNLSTGPLIRGLLLRLTADHHQLIFVQHHIISDGWSIGILLNEFATLYAAGCQDNKDPLPPLNFQYADFAEWQRQFLEGEIVKKQFSFWHKYLKGAPALLELSSDRPRPIRQSFRGNQFDFNFDKMLTVQMQEFSQRHGATLFMTLLAGWSILLAKLSGQTDVVIGTPVANRQRPEVEGLIGFFVNTLPLRVQLEDDINIQELLIQIKESTLSAFENQDLPLDKLVEQLNPERNLSYNPIFQSMFALDNTPKTELLDLPNLSIEPILSFQETSLVDLSLLCTFDHEILQGKIEYASDLFDENSIPEFAVCLKNIIVAMMEDSSQLVRQLVPLSTSKHIRTKIILSAEERHKILIDFNNTTIDYPKDLLIQQVFERQVESTPNSIALVYEGKQLNYAELNEQVNQLAHLLMTYQISTGDIVAIGLERSIENIICLLAILKIGAAYLPLEPSYPAERINYLLEDAKPKLILTHSSLVNHWPKTKIATISFDTKQKLLAQYSNKNPVIPGLVSSDLAYVIYTSGSTGQPKGVMVEHRNVLRLVLNTNYAPIIQSDRVAHCANPAFDASTWEIWAPLLNGASLLVVPPATVLDSVSFNQLLISQKVTAMWLTAGLFNEYVDHLENAFSHLNWLLVGGDVLDPKSIARALNKNLPPSHLINGYGPTETTTFAATFEITKDDLTQGPIPIGRPISNTQIYILDSLLEPVPIGIDGEIYIGGDGVSRGYLNNPKLTDERFINDRFSNDAAAKLYKTGDLGRWKEDGCVDFLGRNDHQVKLRGYRIELGEIETQLKICVDIKDAIVLIKEFGENDKRLIAYLILDNETEFNLVNLRHQLKDALPAFMLPSDFIIMQKFPLTINGKTDRKNFPDPQENLTKNTKTQIIILTPEEEVLAGIWRKLLKRERIDNEANFFELGGHSLLATRLSSQIRQTFGIDFPLRAIFESPTLSQMTLSILAMSTITQSSVLEKLLNDLDNLNDEQAHEQLQENNILLADESCLGVNHD